MLGTAVVSSGIDKIIEEEEEVFSINQSIYISCLWDSSGESTDNNWENNIH